MKIVIPKVLIAVPLGEYAPELQGKSLHVWVNQPKEKLQEYDDLVTELQEKSLAEARKTLEGREQKAEGNDQQAAKDGLLSRTIDQLMTMVRGKREHKADGIDVKLLSWYAEMWSQGPEDARWTVAELQELEAQDPSFLSWCIARSWDARNEHIARKKKV